MTEYRLLQVGEVTKPDDEVYDVLVSSWVRCEINTTVTVNSCPVRRASFLGRVEGKDWQEAIEIIQDAAAMLNEFSPDIEDQEALERRALAFLSRVGELWTGQKLQAAYCEARGIAANWDEDKSIDQRAWIELAKRVNASLGLEKGKP